MRAGNSLTGDRHLWHSTRLHIVDDCHGARNGDETSGVVNIGHRIRFGPSQSRLVGHKSEARMGIRMSILGRLPSLVPGWSSLLKGIWLPPSLVFFRWLAGAGFRLGRYNRRFTARQRSLKCQTKFFFLYSPACCRTRQWLGRLLVGCSALKTVFSYNLLKRNFIQFTQTQFHTINSNAGG